MFFSTDFEFWDCSNSLSLEREEVEIQARDVAEELELALGDIDTDERHQETGGCPRRMAWLPTSISPPLL